MVWNLRSELQIVCRCQTSALKMFNPWGFVLFLAATMLISNCYCMSERTLAMIKPDGVKANYTDAIRGIILSKGFTIVAEQAGQLDEAAAKAFYAEHSERNFFPELIEFMTSGPVLAMVLEKEHAIKEWRALMGPTDSEKARIQAPNSVRAKFGADGQKNCVHGSDSPESAAREIAAFFDLTTPVHGLEKSTKRHDEL